jgi:DNA-binding transcriptional LysR family regulator
VELNQIRYFAVLARTLHFTRAAEECSVSQPALTRAIQRLETELGGALFHRERARTQLTELGSMVLPPLERALANVQEAKSQAEAFRRRETSPLRIGLEHSVPAALLTPIMISFRGQRTRIMVTLHQAAQHDLCERLLSSEIDLALLVDGPDLPERLHRWPMFWERYVAICLPEHKFTGQDVISAQELAEECLLLHEDAACPVRRFVANLRDSLGIRLECNHFGNSLEQLLEMVRASLGVSLAGERQPADSGLARRPIAAEPDGRTAGRPDGRTIVLATAAGRQLGPTPGMFVRLLRAHAWSQLGPAGGQPA